MLIKNTFYSTINSFLRFLSTALLYIILARALGVEEFGRFIFALAFTGIFFTFIDYGFSLFIVKEASQKPERITNLVKSIINSKLLLSIFFTVVLFITLKFLNYPKDTVIIVAILWLAAIFYSFGFFFNNVFRGLNKFQYETYPTILLNAAQFTIVGIFLLLGFKTLFVAIAYLLSRILYFAYSTYLINTKVEKISFTPNFSESIKNLKKAWPYGIHAILATLYFQIDTVFLSYFKGNVEVGYYQAAMRILMASMIIYEAIVSAFFPLVGESIKNDKKAFERYASLLNKIVIFTGAALGLGIFIFSDLIITLLYGKEYLSSIIIMKILAGVIFLRFLGAGYALFITVAEGQTFRAIGVGVSVVVNIILNLILIPKYGAVGAAVASLLTHIVLTAIFFYFSLKLTNSVFVDNYLLKGALFFCLSLTLLFIKAPQGLLILLFIAILLISTKLILNNDELKSLAKYFQQRV